MAHDEELILSSKSQRRLLLELEVTCNWTKEDGILKALSRMISWTIPERNSRKDTSGGDALETVCRGVYQSSLPSTALLH